MRPRLMAGSICMWGKEGARIRVRYEWFPPSLTR